MMEASSRAIAYTPSGGFPLALGLSGDERLAKLVANGNERAFDVLFERYHQPLYRYCCSIVRHEVDAQDALQSTFAGALVALRRGQRDAPLKPWLFRIAHNESISLLRRRRPLGEEFAEGLEPHVASAEERAQERERLDVLVTDLQDLPDRQRGALVMRELSGLSHEEIAAALGTSTGTAKQAIFEARSALLEYAEGRAMGCEEIRHRISDGDRRALRGRRVRAHLRDCGTCAAFAAAIPERRAELHALAAPLAPLAAAGLLGRLSGGGSAFTGAGGRAAGTVAGKLAGAGLTGKTLVTAAVVTGAAAGMAGTLARIHHLVQHSGSPGVSAGAGAAATGHVRAHQLASGRVSEVVLEPTGGRRGIVHNQTIQPKLRTSRTAITPTARGHAWSQGRYHSGPPSWAGSPSQSHGLGSTMRHSGGSGSHGSRATGSQRSAANRGGSTTSRQPPARGSAQASGSSKVPPAGASLTGKAASTVRHAGLKPGGPSSRSHLPR